MQGAEDLRARARNIKEDLQRKRELLKNFMAYEKRREKQQVQKINAGLLLRIKQAEEENAGERRRRVEGIKEREKIVPFKIRYMLLKRRERVKELETRRADQDRNVIAEKQRELELLTRMESVLSKELTAINQSKNSYMMGEGEELSRDSTQGQLKQSESYVQ